MDEDDILMCSKCHQKPRFYEVTGLWYIQCPGKCERMEVGLTKKKVIENWNEVNRNAFKYVPKSQKYRPGVIKNEFKGVGKGETIYQLSSTGAIVNTFRSCTHLGNVLEMTKNQIVKKFYTSKTGFVTIKGIVYYREPKNDKNNAKATSTTAC